MKPRELVAIRICRRPATACRYLIRPSCLVWFVTERGAVISYSVVLVARHQQAWHTIRVYDNAHGHNEFHRHTLAGGKQPAKPFLSGDFGEAMRAARAEVLAGYEKMVEAWRS